MNKIAHKTTETGLQVFKDLEAFLLRVKTEIQAVPEIYAAIEKRNILTVKASSLLVFDALTRDNAQLLRKDIQAVQKSIVGSLENIKSGAHKIHKTITGIENEFLSPLSEADSILGKRVDTWNRSEKERIDKQNAINAAIAQEKERKLREEADKKAAELREKGKEEKAAAIEQYAEDLHIAYAYEAAPKMAAGKSVPVASVEILNLAEVLRAIADEKLPVMAVVLNESLLSKHCKNMGWKNGDQKFGLKFKVEEKSTR